MISAALNETLTKSSISKRPSSTISVSVAIPFVNIAVALTMVDDEKSDKVIKPSSINSLKEVAVSLKRFEMLILVEERKSFALINP